MVTLDVSDNSLASVQGSLARVWNTLGDRPLGKPKRNYLNDFN